MTPRRTLPTFDIPLTVSTFHARTEVCRDVAIHLVGPGRECRKGDRDRLARFRRGLEDDQIFRELVLRLDR